MAAAILAPLAGSAITEDSVVRMGTYSLPRWKELIDTLLKPIFFQQDGTLILWHRQDAHEAARFTSHLETNCRHNPLLSLPQKLDSAQLRTIEPGVADRFTQGLLLQNEGQLDNRQLLDALLSELQILKVKCYWEPRAILHHKY
nr:FAD-dependent oxidoreductase [Polynucleobacter necessarius]